MSKELIAVDIDEVLFPMAETFLGHHNQEYGSDFKIEDMKSYYVENLTGETEAQMLAKLERYTHTDWFLKSAPLEQAIECTRELSTVYDLAIVTYRDFFYRGATEKFIDEYFPNAFKDLHYTHDKDKPERVRPKYEICRQLGAKAIIDDSLNSVTQCAEHGMPSVLFGDYPWNRTDVLPEGVTRCKDWPAVLEYFDGRD